MRVAEDGKLDEDVDGEDAPDEDDQLEGGVEGGAGGELAEEVVDVGHEVAGQHQLEHVGGQVVVQEQRAVVEEEGEVVEQVAGQQHLARRAVPLELRLVNVVAESPAAEEIEDQEGGVESEAE